MCKLQKQMNGTVCGNEKRKRITNLKILIRQIVFFLFGSFWVQHDGCHVIIWIWNEKFSSDANNRYFNRHSKLQITTVNRYCRLRRS